MFGPESRLETGQHPIGGGERTHDRQVMHFTIPEIVERKDAGGSPFMTYELHLNGLHHASVRYRQLHNLHQQLKRELPNGLPVFPPKKLMMLTATQLEERKTALEKYLQLISQDPKLSGSLAFNGFLLASQLETWADHESGTLVDLHVYLMNDQKFTIRGRPTLQTDDILEVSDLFSVIGRTRRELEPFQNLAKQLAIPDELIFCFGLYLIQRHDQCLQLVRKFQENESPYIAMKAHRGDNLKLVLRKR